MIQEILFNPLYSAYPKHASTSIDWLPSDTATLYQDNVKKKFTKRQLIDNGWYGTSIEYKFNQHGFRCNEFSNTKNIMFLGCSYTSGVGLPLEDTFSSIVAKQLNLENYNLGLGGSSNMTAFRFGHYWIPILKPDIVVLLSPNKYRFEVINNDTGAHGLKAHKLDQCRTSKFYNDWCANPYNADFDKLKNTMALQFVCSKNNATFVSIDSEDAFADFFLANPLRPKPYRFTMLENDYARDLAHPGKMSHKNIANCIISTINKQTKNIT